MRSLWIRVGRKHTTWFTVSRILQTAFSVSFGDKDILYYLQLWHRWHTPFTSQTYIARVLGGPEMYYGKLLLIGLHMDRKQRFYETWRGDIWRLVLVLGKWESAEIFGGFRKDLWKISKTNYLNLLNLKAAKLGKPALMSFAIEFQVWRKKSRGLMPLLSPLRPLTNVGFIDSGKQLKSVVCHSSLVLSCSHVFSSIQELGILKHLKTYRLQGRLLLLEPW